MILEGKYNTAKVFTNNIENSAVAQIIELCNQKAFENSKIRIMPDVHTAKEVITIEEYQKAMEGIFTTSVKESTIDEAPMAYKPIDEIIENTKDTIEIVDIIRPLYNFKA